MSKEELPQSGSMEKAGDPNRYYDVDFSTFIKVKPDQDKTHNRAEKIKRRIGQLRKDNSFPRSILHDPVSRRNALMTGGLFFLATAGGIRLGNLINDSGSSGREQLNNSASGENSLPESAMVAQAAPTPTPHNSIADLNSRYGKEEQVHEAVPAVTITPEPKIIIDCKQAKPYSYYVKEYGFNEKNDEEYKKYYPDPSSKKYDSIFRSIQEKAVKWASQDVDPVIATWWVLFETGGRFDSYSWSYCADKTGPVDPITGKAKDNFDINHICQNINNGGWQLGYGQQFAKYESKLMPAFQRVHGKNAEKNSMKVKEVYDRVIEKSSQTEIKDLSGMSLQEIVNKYNDSKGKADGLRKILADIMRDPDISMCMVASVLKQDLHPKSGRIFRDEAGAWGSYYKTHWQKASNLLYDIVKKWNQVCTDNTTNTTN